MKLRQSGPRKTKGKYHLPQFGEIAIKTQEMVVRSTKPVSNPVQAWEEVSCQIFGNGPPVQIKKCPKEAFLGLCDAGMVKGIHGGKGYTRSKFNSRYATKAVEILKSGDDASLLFNKNKLWKRVLKELGMHDRKTPNSQMDVVVSLWGKGLIQ